MRLRSYKHTFPSCADLHLEAPDEVFLESDPHTHAHAHKHRKVLGSVAITSDALIPPPAASLRGPACSARGRVATSREKRLIVGCAE